MSFRSLDGPADRATRQAWVTDFAAAVRQGDMLRARPRTMLSPAAFRALVSSPSTCTSTILTKLDCRFRTEATRRAVELGLLERRP